MNVPPTNAFDKIHSDNGTISAVNFSMPLTVSGGSGIQVKSNNATHTLQISSSISQASGTYNTTQANNVNINSGGYKINFINGTGATVNLKNSGSGNQINVTVSATGTSSGVSSLNALTGALTIACVSGNTTCTNTGGNTITVNTAYNVVVTGGSTQTITKGLTLNALTLGGNAAGGNKNFTGLADVNGTRFFQNGKQVLDTLVAGSGIGISGSGNSRTISNTGILSAITSVNSQTGPSISVIRQPSYTTITNSTNNIKVGIDAAGVMELNGTQTATGGKTFSGGITMSGSNINVNNNNINNINQANLGTSTNTDGLPFNILDFFAIGSPPSFYTDVDQNLYYSSGWKSRQGGGGSHIQMQGGSSLTQGIEFDISDGNTGTAKGGSLNLIQVMQMAQTSITNYVDTLFKTKITQYNSINTKGWGIPAIYGSGRLTGLTGASGTVTSYTVGPSDGDFEVSFNIHATTSTTYSFSILMNYTDDTSVARTVKMPFSTPTAAIQNTFTNTNGPIGDGQSLSIRAKAGTTISIGTDPAGTYTAITYNIDGIIKQIS
uniref:ORF56 n=1 Tax=Nitrosopumilaceae spindle-shaped virus TaxID=3065433 RepID=A0AAT9J9S1_9VIRU